MIHYLLSFNKKRQYALFAGDMFVIALTLFFSYLLRDIVNKEPHIAYVMQDRLKPWLLVIFFSHWLSLYLFDQYTLNRLINPIRSSIAIVLSVWLAGIFISGIFFFFPKYLFGRQALGIHLILLSITMTLWRIYYTKILAKKTKQKRLALVGDGKILSNFLEDLSAISSNGLKIHSVCFHSEGNQKTCTLNGAEVHYDNLLDLLDNGDFDVLAFDSMSGGFSNEETRRILQLKYFGKAVYDLPTLYKNITGKVPLSLIDGRWLLNNDGLQGEMNRPYIRTKRIIDIILSLILLIITFPVSILIAIAVRMDSVGNIFFIQERLGRHRKPFRCLKFRTMCADAEKMSGPLWSSDTDPRITRVGRILRKTRLDELPQLINILKGDMSFVGPRPIREHFANELAETIPFYGIRFSIKPGLSGWAQVNYGYAGSQEGQLIKFQYELFYIQNMSLFLDIMTIFKTIKIVFQGSGK